MQHEQGNDGAESHVDVSHLDSFSVAFRYGFESGNPSTNICRSSFRIRDAW